MRVAAAPALEAVRSIAQLVCSVDMALVTTLVASASMMTCAGEARVNRWRASVLGRHRR